MMHANDRRGGRSSLRGDIAAAVGIKQVVTGAPRSAAPDAPIAWRTSPPRARDQVAVEPKTRSNQEKMSVALGVSRRRNPDLPGQDQRRDRSRPNLGHGRACTWSARRPGISASLGSRRTSARPQSSYRETVRGSVEKSRAKCSWRQTGGSGQFGGGLPFNLEPAPAEGFEFVNKIKGGEHPSEYVPKGRRRGARRTASRPLPDGRPESPRGRDTTTWTPRRSPSRWIDRLSRRPARRATGAAGADSFAVEVVTPEELPRRGLIRPTLSRRRGNAWRDRRAKGNAWRSPHGCL